MELWKGGFMGFLQRKNINRGYQKLIVWQDAADLYVLTCNIYSKFQYELRRVGSNQIASVDSVHRNIAEGYCRRGINEYLQSLNFAMGSMGESVSGSIVYRRAEQISEEEFEKWDALAYKLKNGLKKLIESLQYKRESNDWEDSFILRESNAAYTAEANVSYDDRGDAT
jgi:four helix bundle protein